MNIGDFVVKEARDKALSSIRMLGQPAYDQFMFSANDYIDNSLESNLKMLECASIFLLGWGMGFKKTISETPASSVDSVDLDEDGIYHEFVSNTGWRAWGTCSDGTWIHEDGESAYQARCKVRKALEQKELELLSFRPKLEAKKQSHTKKVGSKLLKSAVSIRNKTSKTSKKLKLPLGL